MDARSIEIFEALGLAGQIVDQAVGIQQRKCIKSNRLKMGTSQVMRSITGPTIVDCPPRARWVRSHAAFDLVSTARATCRSTTGQNAPLARPAPCPHPLVALLAQLKGSSP